MSTNSQITGTSLIFRILNFCFDFAFIFFPSIGFIHQYMKIKRLKNSYGFSKLISLILFVAFIFRIFFWIGKRFKTIILLQSIVGVFVQLFLIKACVEFNNDYKNKKDSDLFNIKEFWNWPYFLDYFHFISILSITLSSVSFILGFDNRIYIEFLGLVSAGVEALIGVPQIWENYKTKNVKTLSYFMIMCWISGDSIKTFYYITSSSPIQLIFCGFAQIIGDFVIIGQIYYYTKIYIKDKISEVIVS
jgi:hypothetical protein